MLSTGVPVGNIKTQDAITMEGAAYIYFQDATAAPLNNPDAQGSYWGLSGTTIYPVYNLGCIQSVTFTENVTVNQVRCDTIGDMDAVQKRNYLEMSVTMLHLFPLSIITHAMNADVATVSVTNHVERAGIGKINNNQFWHVWMPKVYDDVAGDFIGFHFHKAKFVDAWSIAMPSGDVWKLSGIKLRAFFDDTKPTGHEFADMIRSDLSAL